MAGNLCPGRTLVNKISACSSLATLFGTEGIHNVPTHCEVHNVTFPQPDFCLIAFRVSNPSLDQPFQSAIINRYPLLFSFPFFKLFVRISQIQICRVYASTLVFLYQSSTFGMKKSNSSFHQVIFLLFCYSCFELRVVDHCSPWSTAATRLRRNMDNKNFYMVMNSPTLVAK